MLSMKHAKVWIWTDFSARARSHALRGNGSLDALRPAPNPKNWVSSANTAIVGRGALRWVSKQSVGTSGKITEAGAAIIVEDTEERATKSKWMFYGGRDD